MVIDMDPWLSVQEVRKYLRLGTSKAYEIVYALPHLEGPLRVRKSVIDAWIEDNTITPDVA